MGVSGYTGREIVHQQGATAILVGSSGEIKFEPGAEQVGLVGDILFDLSAGFVASASGARSLLASGNPSYSPVNGVTDPVGRARWTSAAGTTQAVHLPSIAVPDDLDTAHPLIFHLYGEGTSGQSTNQFDVNVFFGVGGGNVGTTCSFTSAPSDRTFSVASGSLASAGTPLTAVLRPQAHASGTLTLYSMKATYKKRSRST